VVVDGGAIEGGVGGVTATTAEVRTAGTLSSDDVAVGVDCTSRVAVAGLTALRLVGEPIVVGEAAVAVGALYKPFAVAGPVLLVAALVVDCA